jgi:hypothetical protein
VVFRKYTSFSESKIINSRPDSGYVFPLLVSIYIFVIVVGLAYLNEPESHAGSNICCL